MRQLFFASVRIELFKAESGLTGKVFVSLSFIMKYCSKRSLIFAVVCFLFQAVVCFRRTALNQGNVHQRCLKQTFEAILFSLKISNGRILLQIDNFPLKF